MDKLATYLSELVLSQLEMRSVGPLPEDVSVKIIYFMAKRHSMCRMLLNPLLMNDIIKDKDKNALFVDIARTIVLSEAQIKEMKQVQERLEQRGVINQVLKGSIMKGLYPKPEMREMSDIDLLVNESDMDKAKNILCELGYKFISSEEHHDIYHKNCVCIELHRILYSKHIDNKQFTYFASFKNTHVREGYQYIRDFNVEDFYIYMIAHMAKHFYSRGCGIRNLVDIYVFQNKYRGQINLEYIEKHLEECGIKSFNDCMVELSDIWLRGKESNEFYDALFSYMLGSGLYGSEENGIWNKYVKYDLLDKEASVKKIKRIYYFPPVELIKNDYPWCGKVPVLLPLVWIIRIIKVLFNRKSRKRLEYVLANSPEKVQMMQAIYKNLHLEFMTSE